MNWAILRQQGRPLSPSPCVHLSVCSFVRLFYSSYPFACPYSKHSQQLPTANIHNKHPQQTPTANTHSKHSQQTPLNHIKIIQNQLMRKYALSFRFRASENSPWPNNSVTQMSRRSSLSSRCMGRGFRKTRDDVTRALVRKVGRVRCHPLIKI